MLMAGCHALRVSLPGFSSWDSLDLGVHTRSRDSWIWGLSGSQAAIVGGFFADTADRTVK